MPSKQSLSTRLPLGATGPGELVDARLQCHHAAQVIVSLGISLLPCRDDDSHTNLGWDSELGAFTTHPLPGTRPFRGGLAIAELELLLLNAGEPVRFPLDGKTVADARQWLLGEVSRAGGDATRMTSAMHYTIPEHPVARGVSFRRSPANAFAELAGYYMMADRVIRSVAAKTPGAGEVRCWPHHFDLGTLITLPDNGAMSRTIGVGLSPGDEWYAEPYFYVSPNPYPSPDRLGTLPFGQWHTQSWTGAVLTASNMLSRSDDPQRCASAFVAAAVEACQTQFLTR